ncbi:MAG: PAS domain S-box protein, partial [Gammaproteobacteria bacterium]
DFYANPSDRGKLLEQIHQDGMINDYETDLIDKDGSVRPFSFTGRIVMDENGQAVKLAGVMRDISVRKHTEVILRNSRDVLEKRVQERTVELEVTNDELRHEIEERKLAVDALREQKHFAQTILNSLVDNIAVINKKGVVVSINDSWRDFVRENKNAKFIHSDIGDNYLDACQAAGKLSLEETRQALEGINNVLNGINDNFSMEYACDLPHEKRWFIMYVTPYSANDCGVVISHRNISLRKQVENEVRKERDKAQRYLDTVEAIIISLNTKGEITLINRKGCELLGYTEEELLGKNWFSTCLPQPEGLEQVFPVFEEIMQGKIETAEYFENSVVSRSGERRLIAWHNSYFLDDNGKTIGTLSAGEDITDRKHAEDQARQHQADLAHMARLNIMGEMATGIAHELNQPLSAIATYSDVALRVLADEKELPGKLKEVIIGSQKQARRAAEIIRHLRQLVSKQAPQRKEIHINELITESIKLITAEARKYQVKVNLELENNLPVIIIDAIQVEQVLLNLIRNAMEAMRAVDSDARELTIRSAISNDQFVQVTVVDTGPGIEKQTLRHIFEPFVTTKEGASMGMGLSISRSIIEAHHGNLWVESTFGHGASFYFTLPVNKE